MALTIGTNSSSMAAQRSLISSQSNLQTSFERLSSGSRINSASDDAAGLSIASRLQAQASGLEVAQRNAANGISLVETADAAMGTMVDLMTRARDLVLQYDDGTLSSTDQGAIDSELSDINTELQRIIDDSSFAGLGLLADIGSTGLATGVDIAIAPNGTTQEVKLTKKSDTAIDNDDQTKLGTTLGTATFANLAFNGTAAIANDTTVGNIDKMIDIVNKQRSEFGSLANTFQSTIENLAAVEQGVEAAMGRIMDTDYAKESGELAKNQILQQAGTAILAQANQSQQSVMSLLQ